MSEADVSSTEGLVATEKETPVVLDSQEKQVTTTTTNGTVNVAEEKEIHPKSPGNDDIVSTTEDNGTESRIVEKSKAEEAFELLKEGTKAVIHSDYLNAVPSLAKACELLSAVYGEFADELGNAYFYYGQALFHSARASSDVLGDKIEKDQDESDEEEDDGDEEEDGEDREAKPAASGEGKTEYKSENRLEENQPDQTDGNEGGENEGDDEADDLQLSWEIFEMAKVIYQRKADDDKEIALKLAEVYKYLSDNALESESFDSAISDLQACLRIQEKNLAADDRRIAETHYKLALAYGINNNFDEAIASHRNAIDQLNKRFTRLREAKSAGRKHPDNEIHGSGYSLDEEEAEINAVICSIREKIQDMESAKRDMKKELAEQMGFAPSSSNGASTAVASSSASASSSAETSSFATNASSEAKPVSNISHLIRKKRKNEDEGGSSEKKTKIDDTA